MRPARRELRRAGPCAQLRLRTRRRSLHQPVRTNHEKQHLQVIKPRVGPQHGPQLDQKDLRVIKRDDGVMTDRVRAVHAGQMRNCGSLNVHAESRDDGARARCQPARDTPGCRVVRGPCGGITCPYRPCRPCHHPCHRHPSLLWAVRRPLLRSSEAAKRQTPRSAARSASPWSDR
jgi:hypothetical protein